MFNISENLSFRFTDFNFAPKCGISLLNFFFSLLICFGNQIVNCGKSAASYFTLLFMVEIDLKNIHVWKLFKIS